jgi:hypothetical protein
MLNIEIVLLNLENQINTIQSQLMNSSDPKALMELSIALNAHVQSWVILKDARDKANPYLAGTMPTVIPYQTGA